MSLLCLAIVGKDNEPLYLRDFGNDTETAPDEQDDYFGFASALQSTRDTISLRHEFMMHAALDRMEELLSSEQRWKGRAGNTKWIGKLCPMEDTLIYAYVTCTNIKMMAMVDNPPGSMKSFRDSDLKVVFSKLHEMYIQYTQNPFTKLRDKIVSERFDQGVMDAIKVFNDSAEQKRSQFASSKS